MTCLTACLLLRSDYVWVVVPSSVIFAHSFCVQFVESVGVDVLLHFLHVAETRRRWRIAISSARPKCSCAQNGWCVMFCCAVVGCNCSCFYCCFCCLFLSCVCRLRLTKVLCFWQDLSDQPKSGALCCNVFVFLLCLIYLSCVFCHRWHARTCRCPLLSFFLAVAPSMCCLFLLSSL